MAKSATITTGKAVGQGDYERVKQIGRPSWYYLRLWVSLHVALYFSFEHLYYRYIQM